MRREHPAAGGRLLLVYNAKCDSSEGTYECTKPPRSQYWPVLDGAAACVVPAAASTTICAVRLAPIRSAPASTILRTSVRVPIPPLALTFMPGRFAATARMSVTASTVAPPVEKPVEVLMNAAPAYVRDERMCVSGRKAGIPPGRSPTPR
jgi:hypothetical protein